MHSWRVLILPFIEERDLFNSYDFSQPWNSPDNLKLADQMPEMYAFHGEYYRGLTKTNYLVVVGEDTLWPGAKPRKSADVTDDRSSTILFIENQGLDVHWMEPRDADFATMSFQVNHPSGLSSPYENPAIATDDGQVFQLGPELKPETLRAMLTVNGGEVIPRKDDGVTPLNDGRDRAKME